MRIKNLLTDFETKVISHFDKRALLDGLDKYLRSMGLKKKQEERKRRQKAETIIERSFATKKKNGAADGGIRNKAKKIMINLLFP